MSDTTPAAQIAHVLFLDVVGHTQQTTTAQGRTMDALRAIVQAAPTFAAAKAKGAVQPLPTGDGMALLFYEDVVAPAKCAVEVSRALADGPAIPVRMGAHSGLVQKQIDIAGGENVVGEGINTAQRVMDFGDAGHILLSAQYASWLQQFDAWTPLVHRVGEGSAKHDQAIHVYSLHSDTPPPFGRSSVPSRLAHLAHLARPDSTASSGVPSTLAASAATAGGAADPAVHQPRKVALLYKPNVQPDEKVLRILEEQLRALGHDVFADHQRKIGVRWASAVEERIRASDAVVAIVSPRSMRSEMLEFEVETAFDQQSRTGKPAVLPVRIGGEEVAEGVVASLIQPLRQFEWSGAEDDQRLVTELVSAIHEPPKQRAQEVRLEPVGGAVPPDSPFYVERATDQELRQALLGQESIILIKGARQMGKTSMEGRGARLAREQAWRCAITDFQKFNAAQLASDDLFYRLLAATLARQLRFEYDFAAGWDPIFGANLNMENFLRELIAASPGPLVWFMDEADKLFGAPFASDFFGLVRSWHNSRSTEPGGPWDRLTVVIAYATEAHLFIQDLNQSPFNVGRRIELEDFNVQQMLDLNARCGGPLRTYEEVERLHALIGGQPFLCRKALDLLATGKCDLAALETRADRDDGPFGDHLKRILVSVSRLESVVEYVRALLEGRPSADQDAYFRLLAAGVTRRAPDGGVQFRCEVYERYLRGHLMGG